MQKAKRRTPVPNKGGIGLAAKLKKSGESQASVERRCGFTAGYVSDAIEGASRPNFTKRSIFRAEFGIALGAWDVDIVTKEGAAS